MGKRFAGKTAAVLGASAEGGTGWVIAEHLAAEGARVAVGARGFDKLQGLATKIGGLAVKCDAGVPGDLAHFAKTAHAEMGPIDIAVDAAGWPMPGSIDSITPEQLNEAIAVNFGGPFFFFQQFARVLRDGGAMAIVSSFASVNVTPGQVAYSCAKAAANTLVRYAAVEYGARGIRVNGILPALIATPMSEPFRAMPGVLDAVLREVPLGRPATPADLAQAIMYLVSDVCFATGTLLAVDGGNHLRRSPYPDEFPKGAFESIGP